MKSYKLFLAMLVAVLLAGCAPVDSLNPLYTDKDVVFDKALLGQWGSQKEGLNFAKLGDNAYRMVITQKKDDDTGEVSTIVFEAHLVNLQSHRFLDVVCEEPAGNEQPIPEVHITRTKRGLEVEPRLISMGTGAYLEMLPGESSGEQDRFNIRLRKAHEFFQVVLEDEGRTLKLLQLDNSWIDQQIQDGKLVIDHEVVEGRSAVLIASTPDLQQLVLAHVTDEDAFKEAIMVQRPGPDPML